MTPEVAGPLSSFFLVFCRVGACLMIMAGFSSLHVPSQVRLFLALAISVSVTPLVTNGLAGGAAAAPVAGAAIIAAEITTGAVMGAAGRIIFAAVQFAGSIIAPNAGYTGPGMADDGTGEFQQELGALISAAVLVSMFILDFHTDVIRAAVDSYDVLPIGTGIRPDAALDALATSAAQSLHVAVRLAGPFIVAGVLLNFAFGAVNKIAPQIPVVFISVPFIVAASLWLLQKIATVLVEDATRSILDHIGQR